METQLTNDSSEIGEVGRAGAAERQAERKVALLLSYLAKNEVDAIFAQAPVQLAKGQTIAAARQKGIAARAGLARYEMAAAAALPAELAELAALVRGRPTYVRHYESQADFEFALVPIASLLTPQWQADLTYVDAIAARLGDGPNPSADFATCFPQSVPSRPIIAGNTVVFSSLAPDLAINPVPIVRQNGDDLEIVLRAEARPNYVMVAELEGRLILENGVHKLLALWRTGRTHAPAVLKHVQRPEELAIARNSSLFAPQTYFAAARPPLVTDFLTPAATIGTWKAVQNIYRVVTQVEQIIAPDVAR